MHLPLPVAFQRLPDARELTPERAATPLKIVRGLAAAALLVLGAFGVALVLDPYVPGIPLAVFLIAVTAAAFYDGLVPGLAATALSIMFIDYYLESPYASFALSSPATSVDLVVFTTAALVISWFNASLGRARTRAEIASARARQREEQSLFLTEFATAVNASLDSMAVSQVLAQCAVPRFAEWSAVHFADVHKNLHRTAFSGTPSAAHDDLARTAFDTGQAVVRQNTICVPLVGPEHALGTVAFGFNREGIDNAGRLTIALELAARSASAIVNADLYRAAQEQRQICADAAEAALRQNRLAAALAESVTLEHVGAVILQEAIALTASRGGQLHVVEPEDGLALVAAIGEPLPRSRGVGLLSQQPADTALVRYLNLARSAQGTASPMAPGSDEPIVAVTELVLKDRAIGVLELVLGDPPALTADEAEVLSALVQQGAQALERARLYESERRARADAEDAYRALRGVQLVTDAALTYLDLDDLLRELLDRVLQLLTVDLAAVLIVSDDGASLIECASVGTLAGFSRGARVPIGMGVAGRIAQMREALAIEDLSSATVVSPVLRQAGVRSFLGVPLVTDGVLVGVLHVDSVERRQFAAEERHVLCVVADRIALAISHARLYEAERTARAEAERLAAERAAILAHIADGVITADAAGHISFVNEAAMRFFGVSPEAEGVHDKRTPEWLPDPIATGSLRGALDGQVSVTDLELRGKHERIAVAHAAPVRSEEGAHIGAVLTLRDVTAERMLEQRKDEFFSNVSHDLRTPVATIKGAVEVVLQNEPPGVHESLHRMLQIIDDEADRMSGLVDSLLELSRARSGHIQLDREVTDVRTILDRVASSIEPLVLASRQRVLLDLPRTPVCAAVDAPRLERAIQNLVSNAHKYGRMDGVIAIQLRESAEDVSIVVRDDGPGIPQEDVQRVFERYYRSRDPGTRRIQGSGLGLPIARAIVELHSGRLALESSQNAGCTFRITLPRCLSEGQV